MKKLARIAIVGATGAVGQELLTLMNERSFQFASLTLVASMRSARQTQKFRGETYVIEDLEKFNFSDVDIAFFSAGTEISKVHARRAADEGALVIDNTNAFRMDDSCPLVVPQVNGHVLNELPASRIIANPNCSTIQLVRALDPIDRLYRIEKVIVSTYQAVSGGGITGMQDLMADSKSVLDGGASVEMRKFPRPIGFNVVPQVDKFLDNGFTLEEQKMRQEPRKIMGRPEIRVTSTAVRVPVMNGHSEAVYIECENKVELNKVLNALKAAPEIEVYSDYPTARFLENKNVVHVGRVRVEPEDPCALWLWVVADNLRIGAALNALQIAELVTRQAENRREAHEDART